MKTVFLGIGTNLGNREENLKKAIASIEEQIGHIGSVSSVYETEAWGFQSESEFLNMAIEVETRLGPSGLLGRILMIESLLGRVREGNGFKSRIIDIDILLYSDMVFETTALVVPHPRIQERRFVLVPLCEIAGDMIHPCLGKSFRKLLKKCKDKSKVKIYNNPLSAKL